MATVMMAGLCHAVDWRCCRIMPLVLRVNEALQPRAADKIVLRQVLPYSPVPRRISAWFVTTLLSV